MNDLAAFTGPNAAYVLDLYDQYLRDPSSVDQATRDYFSTWRPAEPPQPATAKPTVNGRVAPPSIATTTPAMAVVDSALRDRIPPEEAVRLAMGVTALARAIRDYGHLAARTDPLGTAPPGDPDLDPMAHHLLEEELTTLSPGVVHGHAAPQATNALEVIQRLRELYCGSTGYDFTHVQSAEERTWLMEAIESGRYRSTMRPDEQLALLQRLTEVETFERYLQDTHRGMTRFSIEGVDIMVPMLDEIIGCAADAGTHDVLMGMAHRGRLNVLAHVLGRPYAAILAEFQASHHDDGPLFSVQHHSGWTGDVKYHAGAQRVYGGNDVVKMSVRLAPNPSHLEFVNPVVEGRTRAAQESREQPGAPTQDDQRALPILIHGDAAFPGEGIVAETLNLSRLPGYRTGGTIHIIANNQIGFTTEPRQGRSTLYASDLAKGFEIPIIHVNADDPGACLSAARLAYAYRLQFRKDVLIDLIGYRRLGHNEGDEPSFTQPQMYARINGHPTVRQLWADRLVAEGVLSADDAKAMIAARRKDLDAAASATPPTDASVEETKVEEPQGDIVTAVPADRLRELNSALFTLPAGFSTRVGRILERRRDALDADGPIDWGHAELLAMASILADGTPIRLTGQDTERGTFGQRHAVVHDAKTGASYTPLQRLPEARASFSVYNSPLSEAAVLGFEYGYSIQAPQVLVLWEAQYGDFINAAQVIVDEFVTSGYAKWRQTPSLVLLLPHGYEGGGPDHSSGRIERFLRQCSNYNIRAANCTTAAQYFHLLRRQAALLERAPRPLVIFTPKSLLRHARAASTLNDLAQGAFQPVIDDVQAQAHAQEVTRVLLCSGKVFVDLDTSPARSGNRSVAIVRLEELYPVPEQQLREVLAHYPACQELLWVQEEPANMGAWPYLAPAIRAVAGPAIRVRYVGRSDRGSPAEGSPEVHLAEQSRLVAEAFDNVPALAQRERERSSMPVDIRVPTLGESVVEGTVLRWYKRVGDAVHVGDALAELETDKVTVDIPADRDGTVLSIVKGEGETAAVGDVLATLEEAPEGAVAEAPSPAPSVSDRPAPVSAPPAAAPSAATGPEPDHVRSTPMARKLAEERGVNLSSVEGSGPVGRVRRNDVEQFLAVPATAAAPPASAALAPPVARPVSAFPALGELEERANMTRRRRTIAQRLVEAQATAAMLTTFNECDLTAIMDLRKRRRDSFKERHGVSLGFMSFFTRAAVGGLKAFPRLNAEIRGDDLILKRHYDIGVAVDTEEGLVVPVVRNADRLSFVEIERTIADLAKRAREGKLSIADLQGGTFTLTNGGVFGSLFSTPIINMPQAAILGMHRIQERPVALNGQVVIRPMMYLALTYDHRIVDGREAVQFLVRLKELVEDPELLLTEA